MRQLPAKIKPTKGFSHLVHILLKALLPFLAFIFVRIELVPIALLLVAMSKWRMFAVRPRYWVANILSNGVDMMVSLSAVLFMANTAVQWWQLFWVLVFTLWLVNLKPRSDVLSVSAQAMIGQLLGLSALFIKFGNSPLLVLVVGTWLVTYTSARHFLTSFEESHVSLLANIWAYTSAGLAFILGHWLIFYGLIPQIIILLTTVGYSLAALYYFEAADRLTIQIQRQLLFLMSVIVLILIIFSDWSGKPIG